MADIISIHQSSMREICNLAPLGDYVYYLFQRRDQPEPYWKVNVHTNEVSEAYLPPYPLTTWFWAKHLNKIVFMGQAYTEGWETPDPCNPTSIACSVVCENGNFSFHIIPHTDNVNELIGACYHDGEFKAGERSGYLPHEDPDYYKKCADHKDGGGIWISQFGRNWRWSGFRDPYLNLGLIEFGREAYLAVLNGKFYAFMHGGMVPERVKTSIYEVHGNYSTTHIADTPDPNIGLVPFPFNPDENNQFSWKGAIIMRSSYPKLAVFNPALSPPLQFWNITVDGVPVRNAGAVPVGIYNDKLLIATARGGNYTVCQASELFGSVTRIADNWMSGSYTKGVVANNKLWMGVQGVNGSALDMFPLEEVPLKYRSTFIVRDPDGNPLPNARVVME